MEVAALGLRVDGAGNIDAATDSLGRFSGAGANAEKAAKKLSDGSAKSKNSINNFSEASRRAARDINQMAAAAVKAGAILVAALGANAIRNYADSWSDMQSVVGAATGNMEEAGSMMTRLVDLANASYSPLQQTVDIYSRNVGVLKELGKSSAEAADFTESLNHMLVLTATRGERATSVQNALSKAMAVGRLQTDGLETVLANGGEVAQALANELGIGVNQLREFSTQGKITGEVIANAIIKPLEDVAARAGEMPATMGDAMTIMSTNITEFVGKIDKATGASSSVADAIISVAGGIRTAGDYIIAFGALIEPAFSLLKSALSSVMGYADIATAALAGFFAPALLGGIATLTVSLAVGLVGAIKAVTLAMLANPIGLIVGALTAAGYAAYKFRNEIQEWIGVDVVKFAQASANNIVQSFLMAYEYIRFAWMNFGNVIGGFFVGAANAAISAINALVRSTLSIIDNLTSKINSVIGTNIGSLGDALQVELIQNNFVGNLNANFDALGKRINEIAQIDMFAKSAESANKLADAADGGSKGQDKPKIGGTGKLAAAAQNQYIAQMQERIALIGQETEAEQLLARIRVGSLKFASAAEREYALVLASTYDAMMHQQELTENLANLMDRLYPKEARAKLLAENVQLLNQAFAEGLMPLEQYADAVNRLYSEETEDYWSQWLEGLREATEDFQELAANMIDSFTTNFSDAVGRIVTEGGSLRDMFADVAQSMAQNIISALVKMGTQWLIYQVVQKTAMSGAQSAAATSLIANAVATQQQASLAAYASTAAIPVTGPAAAPVAAAAAITATTPMVMAIQASSLAGMAHDGIDKIPEDGTWYLQKGERVTTANTSAKLDSVLSQIDARQRQQAQQSSAPSTASGLTVNLIENQERAGQVDERRNDDGTTEINVFVADIRGGGQRSRALEATYGLKRVGA